MKGKIDLRFNQPNLSKVRTRLADPVPKDFTQNARQCLAEACAEVLEEQNQVLKQKMIDKLGLDTIAKEEHLEALKSLSKDYFFTQFAVGAEAAKTKFDS